MLREQLRLQHLRREVLQLVHRRVKFLWILQILDLRGYMRELIAP